MIEFSQLCLHSRPRLNIPHDRIERPLAVGELLIDPGLQLVFGWRFGHVDHVVQVSQIECVRWHSVSP